MATRHSTDPRARRFERVIRRAIDTGNRPALRAVATIAMDHGLGAAVARAEAALKFVGGHNHA